MARIFLSYARSDAAQADRIANAIAEGGHEVWWDRRIATGASFSDEIDKALAAADAVVVLWSHTSVKSNWVRDEAANGRDTGRLIPVLIDRVEPPLGFRQYQAIDLSGDPDAGIDTLVRALGSDGTDGHRRPLQARKGAVLGASARYRGGGELHADMALNYSRTAAPLWSGVIDVPQGRQSDFREQVSATVGQVLMCLSQRATRDAPLKDHALSLFLAGCAEENPDKAIPIFTELTNVAPKFGPGWAYLASAAALQVPVQAENEIAGLVATARKARDRAKELAPDDPQTALADALVSPGGGRKFDRGLKIIDAAIAKNPDSPTLYSARSYNLQMLGRMREAVSASRRALDLNPLSPALFDEWVSALAYSGRADTGFAELAKAEKVWPGSSRLADARFRLDFRFGDARRALAYLNRADARYEGKILDDSRIFLATRADPAPAKVDAMLDQLRERYDRNHEYIYLYLQALVTFNHLDEAFAALEPTTAIDSLGVGPDILFRPYMAAMRRDSRFIGVAKRLGLADVWQETRTWPDFCDEGGLPYECQRQAAALTKLKDETEAARRVG